MVAGRYVAAEVAPGLHRLELPAAALGLVPPPSYTELSFHPARRGWTVRALAGKPQADDLGRWLRALGADAVHATPGREPGLKAVLPSIPDVLAYAHSLGAVESVTLGSDGSAILLLRAPRAAFQDLVAHVAERRAPEHAVPELTLRQAELLQFCQAKGYYTIPRKATLRDLAKDLGISPTALSLALRRAEARVLGAYVERLRHGLPRKPGKRARKAG